jgi:hypothetical protein
MTYFVNWTAMLPIVDEFRTLNWLEIDKQLKYSGMMAMFQFV